MSLQHCSINLVIIIRKLERNKHFRVLYTKTEKSCKKKNKHPKALISRIAVVKCYEKIRIQVALQTEIRYTILQR